MDEKKLILKLASLEKDYQNKKLNLEDFKKGLTQICAERTMSLVKTPKEKSKTEENLTNQ